MSIRQTVYIPIFKIRAQYMVKQGRSWSAFEHMVLWKLAQEPATSSDLAKLAAVPVRLVVECLIELMSAGWVELRTTGNALTFEATSIGKRMSELKQLPEDTRTRKRGTMLCVDRLAMCFFEPEDLTVVHKDRLPENATVLRSRIFKLTMTPGSSVDRLYMREDEAFAEWVDYRITSQRLYAAVQVSGRSVEGLPPYTPQSLLDAITQEVGAGRPQDSGQEYDETPDQREQRLETEDGYCLTDVTTEDIVVGGREHFDTLTRVIAEARTFAVIHTCFVHPNAVRRILPLLEAAVTKRKVRFDLLWGQRSESMNESALREFREAKSLFEKLPANLRSHIRFADEETGSHAKAILADSGPHGRIEAYIGSCNWLSSLYSSVEVSLRVQEPRVIGTIASALALLRIPSSGKWTADVYRLAEIRNNCFKLGIRNDGSHSIAVVRDREHLAAIREARDFAQRRIFAACDIFGPAGETSVFVPMRVAAKDGVAVTLMHRTIARSLSIELRDQVVKALSNQGIDFLSAKNIHGKFLIWDDDALLITSFNWLATTPDPWKPHGAEIGLIVKGPGLAENLKERFCKLAEMEVPSIQAAPLQAS